MSEQCPPATVADVAPADRPASPVLRVGRPHHLGVAGTARRNVDLFTNGPDL
jgi:hypothetical protein